MLELNKICTLEELYDCLSEAYHNQCPIELLAENKYWIDIDNDGEFEILDNGMIKITHINFFDPENPPLFM